MFKQAALALCVLVAAPAHGQDVVVGPEAPAASQIKVRRPGDDVMSCDALAAEITELNERLTAVQMQMNEQATAMSLNAGRGGAPANLGMSPMIAAAGLAAAFVPGGNLALGAVGAASSAQVRSTMAEHDAQTREREAIFAGLGDTIGQLQPLGQRIEHLTALSRARSC